MHLGQEEENRPGDVFEARSPLPRAAPFRHNAPATPINFDQRVKKLLISRKSIGILRPDPRRVL